MQYNYNGSNPIPPNNPNPNDNENLRRKNRNLMYALIGVLVLGLGGLAYFLTRNKSVETTTSKKDSFKLPSPFVASDSATIVDSPAVKVAHDEYYDEEGSPYSEQYSIANEAYLRTSPSENAGLAGTLKFGNKVWIDNNYSGSNYKKVYLNEPGVGASPAYYVVDYVLTYPGEFDDFKKYFSLPPFSGIGTKMKKLILDNDYSDSRHYEVTQNAARAKTTFAYGDFDKDGITDLAVALDDNEDQYSRLLILCTNAATKEPYLAYAENFEDRIQINSFKKNALIFMWTEDLINAPADGVMINNEGSKRAIVYDPASQKFKMYAQESTSSEE